MDKKILMGIVTVVIILGGAAVILSQNKVSAPTAAQPQANQSQPTVVPSMTMEPTQASASPEPSVSPTGATGKKAVKEFTVTGANFKFNPATITVKKGDVVTIVFKNAEGFHDFVLDEFNVKTNTISAGQEETVQFTADKAGNFEYYCSVGNHRQMGMKGTLIVQ